ncbi:MAG: molybdate ABC transporter substrate-binding protein, partial [Aquificae bacterium]|nr:molybdate ABC transporter substrate-binding protein [Aquificota bacterium]
TSCSSQKETLTVLTAAGLKEPFDRLVELYERENPSVEVRVVYGGSGELLALLNSERGDLFIPAGRFYADEAAERGLVDPSTFAVLVEFVPVLVVREEVARKVKKLEDLLREDVRVGVGDPRAASIGRATRIMFEKLGLWDRLEERAVVKTPTVSQLLFYLKTGQVDATVIWRHLVRDLKGVKVVPIPEEVRVNEAVVVSVTSFTENRKAAESFKKFLLDRKEVFKNYGF